MKENEAIETLISIRRVSGYSKKREEALDMAIAALEKQKGEGGLTMAEYIEREAALAFAKHIIVRTVNGEDYCRHCIDPEDIAAIPAADVVEVRHGQWRQNDNGTWSCSECSSWIPDEQHYYARFCLHCGAKMDGGTNK